MVPAKSFAASTLIVLTIFVCACGSSAGPANIVYAQAESPQATENVEEPAEVTIVGVGDIMLGSPYPNDTRMPPNDGADLLKEFAPILSAADIAFGNLEGPIIDDGISEKCPQPRPGQPVRCFAFRMPTRYARYLKEAGLDVLSLANNHAGDFGDIGRASTRTALDNLGIRHAGSDRFQFSTAILEVKGLRVAFVAFAHNNIVPNVNDLETARRLVEAADKKADIVVVSFHGGAEGTGAQSVPWATELYFGEKRGNLPLFARTVIDAGADLVLGHGPHVLRGMEIYNGRLIAYSLGNFATYGWFKLEAETALTMALEVRLAADGKFLSGRIYPGRQDGRGGPKIDPSGEAIKKVRALSLSDFAKSAPLISDDGAITAK